MKRTKHTILWLLVILPILLNAQEQLGLRYEKHSGVNSIVINPANNLTSPLRWDVNLVEAGAFFDNNYAFVYSTHLPELIEKNNKLVFLPELDSKSQANDDELLADFRNNNRPYFLSLDVSVLGPSFIVHNENGISYGLFTRARAMVSSQRIPSSLGYYSYENALVGDEISIPKFKVAGMSWMEYGANFAKQYYGPNGDWGFGINARLLHGYEAFYIHQKEAFQLTQLSGDSLGFSHLNANYGFTNSSIEAERFDPRRNGWGLGFDLGFTWVNDSYEGDYDLKLGASLIDLGRISFARHAESHRINFNTDTKLDPDDFSSVEDYQEATDLLSELLLGNSSQSLQSDEFDIWLPVALSLQADYKISSAVFLNAILVQRIPLPGPALERDNLLAVSPRLEHRWYGLSFPISVYNWRDLHLGTAVRLGFITLGSDNIRSWISRQDFTGTDLYVAFKVNPFDLNLGKKVRPYHSGKKAKRGQVRCYRF